MKLLLLFQNILFLENIQYFYYVILVNPSVKRIDIAFLFSILFIAFLFITLSTLNSFWFVSLQLLFVKVSNTLFDFNITNIISLQNSVFNSFNNKHFFSPIWKTTFLENLSFAKLFLLSWYSYMIINFKVKTYLIILLLISKQMLGFTSTGLILIALWYVCIYSLCHPIDQYDHFLI